MTHDSASTPRSTPRVDGRKARTRGALVQAAQTFIASGSTSISIQDLTDSANVGFGSFYYHFDSKDELFVAAVSATLESWGALRDQMVVGITDPARIFSVSFRMTGRLQRLQPELVRILLHSGTSILAHDLGLRPRAIADLEAGIRAGRFAITDSQLGFMTAGGALLGLLQMLDADSALDDADVTDQFAERLLVMLGMAADEAHDLSREPLGPLPELSPAPGRAAP